MDDKLKLERGAAYSFWMQAPNECHSDCMDGASYFILSSPTIQLIVILTQKTVKFQDYTTQGLLHNNPEFSSACWFPL